MGGERIPEFLAGDVVLCAAKGDMPGWLTGWGERAFGEGPTYAVHTAQLLDGQTILELDFTAKVRPIEQFISAGRGFEVWRLRWLTPQQRHDLTVRTLRYLGARFGWAKFVTHALDGVAGKITRRQVFFFRKLNHNDRYPICSWITAFAYDRVLGYQFGVPPECADPDQIHDWVKADPEEWELVYRQEAHSRQAKENALTAARS